MGLGERGGEERGGEGCSFDGGERGRKETSVRNEDHMYCTALQGGCKPLS